LVVKVIGKFTESIIDELVVINYELLILINMPLNIPFTLPAVDVLREENIFVMDSERASSQEIRPLKIVILNLMPVKITTETDLIRLLSNSPLQIEIDFLHMESHT